MCDLAVFWAAIVVLSSVSLLFGSAFVFVSTHPQPRCVEVQRGVEVMAEAVQRFRQVHERCPGDVDELVARSWIRRHDGTDPWGRRYVVVCSGRFAEVQVCASGPDGEDPRDDICGSSYSVGYSSRSSSSRTCSSMSLGSKERSIGGPGSSSAITPLW